MLYELYLLLTRRATPLMDFVIVRTLLEKAGQRVQIRGRRPVGGQGLCQRGHDRRR